MPSDLVRNFLCMLIVIKKKMSVILPDIQMLNYSLLPK